MVSHGTPLERLSIYYNSPSLESRHSTTPGGVSNHDLRNVKAIES